jgi:hypothetical protein
MLIIIPITVWVINNQLLDAESSRKCPHLSKDSTHFMECEYSLLCSQNPLTCLGLEPVESSPCPTIVFMLTLDG